MLTTSEREILIYYNPDSASDRKTVAYAQTLSPHVKAFGYDEALINGTDWEQIVQALHLHPKDLLNDEDPYFAENIAGKDFDEASWLKILEHNHFLIKSPIALRGEKAVVCSSPKDIYQLADEHAAWEEEE